VIPGDYKNLSKIIKIVSFLPGKRDTKGYDSPQRTRSTQRISFYFKIFYSATSAFCAVK